MNHVRADGVGPMHVSPNGSAGVVLKKHVVVTVPENGAVGIVHPVVRGKKMKLRPKGIGGQACGPAMFCSGEIASKRPTREGDRRAASRRAQKLTSGERQRILHEYEARV